MSAPLPNALRERFQRLIEEGSSGRAAALRLKLSPATGARWGLAIRRTGRVRAAPLGRPGGKGKLDPHPALLIELIDQDGDMTMPELAGALADATGVQAHPDAIGRFPCKLGFTYKKKRWSRPSDAAQGQESSAMIGSNTVCQPCPPSPSALSSLMKLPSKPT